MAVLEGRYGDRQLLADSLRSALELRADSLGAFSLGFLAAVLLADGRAQEATQVHAQANRILDETSLSGDTEYRSLWRRIEAEARKALGAVSELEWERGRALPLAAAVDVAVAE